MLRTRRRRASDDENEGRCLNVWEEVFITTTIYVSWFWTALHRGVNNSNSRETRISSIITITNHIRIWVLSIFLRKRKLVSQLVNPGWIRKRRIHMTQCHCITQYFHTLDSNKMNKFFTEVLVSQYRETHLVGNNIRSCLGSSSSWWAATEATYCPWQGGRTKLTGGCYQQDGSPCTIFLLCLMSISPYIDNVSWTNYLRIRHHICGIYDFKEHLSVIWFISGIIMCTWVSKRNGRWWVNVQGRVHVHMTRQLIF